MPAHRTLSDLQLAMQQNHGDLPDATALSGGSTGLWSIVTEAAETATLAAPEGAGLIVGFLLHTDGGDMVITVADTVDVAGNNTITLDTADELCVLISFPSADGFQWRVLIDDDATGSLLSTV